MKWLLLLLSLPAFGMTFPEYVAEKKKNISHERHLPFVLDHGRKTEKAVLLIHGIFSSPLYFKAMAKAFHDRGHNVVTVILPGHWEKSGGSSFSSTETRSSWQDTRWGTSSSSNSR